MQPNPIPDRLQFWLKHDTWTHAQAALLLCGLDPQHCEISNEGQLMGTQARALNGHKLNWHPDPPPILPPHPLAEAYKMILEAPRGVLEQKAKWQMTSQQLQDCMHLLQASLLAERAPIQQYLEWAKRKDLGQYIFATLGDGLSSVLGESDEQPGQVAEPPAQPAPPATDPSPEEGSSSEDHLLRLAALFDPVKVGQLEAMFPKGQWAKYAERALRNGLVNARAGRGAFNPLLAAEWWVSSKGPSPSGWDWERCLTVLERNLPARSEEQRGLFPQYD